MVFLVLLTLSAGHRLLRVEDASTEPIVAMSSTMQRAQLSEFLKSCRARLSPATMGLPAAERRRTPGLRREDVAALAGLSATWYTWLEQGRDVRASDRVLESLSRTLRLSTEERDYLFSLAQSRPAPLQAARVEALSPAIKRTLEAMHLPVEVITPRWDVVYWNRMITKTFRDYGAMAPEQRNLARILLTGPEYQEDREAYEAMAKRVMAKLRVDYSQAGADPAFDALIDELNEICPIFRRLWRSPEIMARSEGVHILRHPQFGAITFEHTSYQVEGAPTLRVVIFAPHDEDSAIKLARLARDEGVVAI
jgi:transcriptional regulator with XRE-family HTH domain